MSHPIYNPDLVPNDLHSLKKPTEKSTITDTWKGNICLFAFIELALKLQDKIKIFFTIGILDYPW